MKDPKHINSLNDFLWALNLAEQIEFFKISRGTEMDSKIAGPVTFFSLNKTEPRICVIEDGEKAFYYSDGRFKPNGSVVLDFKGYPKINFKNSHIDKEGNPINLPTKLDEPAVLTFLSNYNFIEGSSTQKQINLDWIKTKDALHRMCKYYNLFSLNDKEKTSHNTPVSDFSTLSYWTRNSRDETDRNRYMISFESNTSDDYSERRSKPYILSIVLTNASTPSRMNYLPFRFINKKAAKVFIENFQSELTEVIRGWRRLLSLNSSVI